METRHLSIPLLLPTEGDCESCVRRLKEVLLKRRGILSAQVEADAARLVLTFDPSLISLEELERCAKQAGVEVARHFAHQTFRLAGLDCSDCAAVLERGISRLPGVVWVAVSVPASRMLVEYDKALLSHQDISRKVLSLGYQVVGRGPGAAPALKERLWRHRRLLTTSGCGLLAAGGWVMGWRGGEAFSSWLYLAAVGVGGYPILRGAVGAIWTRTLEMNVLMSVAVVGAVLIGHAGEAAAVVFLFGVGSTLEGFTMERTRRALETLMKLAPERARVKRGEEEKLLPTEEVKVGEVIVIRPGERIPLDGEVIKGASSLDESPITGESMSVQKGEGDQVLAGSINEYGSLEVRVGRPAAESTLARILALIEEAETRKTPSQKVIDRFARYYTPAVIFIALGVAAIPPLAMSEALGPWAYRALTLLVVSCPCALVIATPVAAVAALSAAAREGVLIKGGLYLEEIAGLRALALDKTGTLTYGKARVTDVIGLNEHQPEEVLTVAAAVESRSEHHLGGAVMEAARKEGITAPAAADFQALPGVGAKAQVNGKACYVGSPRLLAHESRAAEEVERLSREGKTALVVIAEESPLGVIGLADVARPEAAGVVARLRKLGIANLTMLTGDNSQVARDLTGKLGLEDWRAELLPHEKVEEVTRLRAEWGKVAMVGDGVNDAPALAASSVGIAMGGTGTDVSLETADVVLMGDDLSRLPYLVGLGRKTIAVMRQNIAISLLVKFALLLMAFPGWLTLWLAVMGDTGVSLLVMVNGMRLLARRARL